MVVVLVMVVLVMVVCARNDGGDDVAFVTLVMG